MFEYRSKSIKNIGKAIMEIRKEMPKFVKEGANNPGSKTFKCIKLEIILANIYPLCDKQGTCLIMDAERIDDDIWAYVRLTHLESEEFIASSSYLFHKSFLNADTQQDAGEIMTYQYRNLLRILIGIVSDEHDIDQGKKPNSFSKQENNKRERREGCIELELSDKIYNKLKDYPAVKTKILGEFGIYHCDAIKESDDKKFCNRMVQLITEEKV